MRKPNNGARLQRGSLRQWA